MGLVAPDAWRPRGITDLEPNAWKHESVKMAAEALAEIKAKGYMLEGTEGLDHIQSQTRWNEGKAAFIPSGSWLENEQKKVAPEGFATTVAPTPLLDGATLPFQSTRVIAAPVSTRSWCSRPGSMKSKVPEWMPTDIFRRARAPVSSTLPITRITRCIMYAAWQARRWCSGPV